MEADLLLCDHAESVNGKLYINGGGWNVLWAPGVPITMFLAVLVTVDWTETNTPHRLVVELRSADGELIEVGADPPQPVRAGSEIELGRPPGVKAGTSLVAPLTFGFQMIVLEAGSYVWHLNVGDAELARKTFQVVAPPHLPGFPPQL